MRQRVVGHPQPNDVVVWRAFEVAVPRCAGAGDNQCMLSTFSTNTYPAEVSTGYQTHRTCCRAVLIGWAGLAWNVDAVLVAIWVHGTDEVVRIG